MGWGIVLIPSEADPTIFDGIVAGTEPFMNEYVGQLEHAAPEELN